MTDDGAFVTALSMWALGFYSGWLWAGGEKNRAELWKRIKSRWSR